MAGKSSGDSCIVGSVEPPTHSDELRLVNSQGPLSRDEATRLLDRGVLVAPGSFLGQSGEGYVRFALVPTQEECERAVEILADVL